MSELYLVDLIREARPTRRAIKRRRYLRLLAVPVTIAVVFGVFTWVVDGRWATGLAFIAGGVAIGVVFWKGVEL